MEKYLVVAFGGALGSVLRYWVSGLDVKYSRGLFPVSTFLVNVLGSLVIGLLWGLFERLNFSPLLRIFLFVGILGGFTTFSSFSLENLNLIRDGEYRIALIYILLTNVVGLSLAFYGYFLARMAVK
ncbi:MAG: fluoride efflux transporter CrcB [Candidatus Firestonebacteria bacterium]